MKARMKKISVDVAVTINQFSLRKSTSRAQVFKTVEFLIHFIIPSTIYGQVFSVRVICKVLQPFKLINKALWYVAVASFLIEYL